MERSRKKRNRNEKGTDAKGEGRTRKSLQELEGFSGAT